MHAEISSSVVMWFGGSLLLAPYWDGALVDEVFFITKLDRRTFSRRKDAENSLGLRFYLIPETKWFGTLSLVIAASGCVAENLT